jgi:hypothetical protein
MRKLFIAALFLLSLNAFAVDQHTFIHRIEIDQVVAAHSTYLLPTETLPQDLDSTHVWTGVGMCLLAGSTSDTSYNPFTEQLALQGWLINVDAGADPSQYYFNSQLMSNKERCVYQAFTPENNVHMHHLINAVLSCKNFGNSPTTCRARLWIHYKK